MNLSIDLGNTLAKVGIFEKRQFREMKLFPDVDDARTWVKNFSPSAIIISSVSSDSHEFIKGLGIDERVVILSRDTSLPIGIRYSTPGTLGVDRIAAACGAFDIFPYQNCLVVDAGTCVTYELIDREGIYLGGGISPGLSMRFKAMHTFTKRLPLVEPSESPSIPGDSTIGSMQSGVVLGMIDEIEGAITRYSEKFGDLKVILTGGDCLFFENKLKASIFASPELVLKGLNSILLHNISD